MPSAGFGRLITHRFSYEEDDERERPLAIWNETAFEKSLKRVLKKKLGDVSGDEYMSLYVCGAPARGGSPGAGAYRSNQDHHRPEDSCAPAKRCRRESRVALRAPMPLQDVVKPLARPKNDGSGFETV